MCLEWSVQGKAGEKLRRGRMMGGSCCLWREVQVLEKGRVWGSPCRRWRGKVCDLSRDPVPAVGRGAWGQELSLTGTCRSESASGRLVSCGFLTSCRKDFTAGGVEGTFIKAGTVKRRKRWGRRSHRGAYVGLCSALWKCLGKR